MSGPPPLRYGAPSTQDLAHLEGWPRRRLGVVGSSSLPGRSPSFNRFRINSFQVFDLLLLLEVLSNRLTGLFPELPPEIVLTCELEQRCIQRRLVPLRN